MFLFLSGFVFCFVFFWSKLRYSLDVVLGIGKNLYLRNNTNMELCNFLDVMSASELLCCMTRCNQIRTTVCLIPYFSQIAWSFLTLLDILGNGFKCVILDFLS